MLLLSHTGPVNHTLCDNTALFVHLQLILNLADNVGVFLEKDKCQPQQIKVRDFLSGKVLTIDVDELAAR